MNVDNAAAFAANEAIRAGRFDAWLAVLASSIRERLALIKEES